MLLPRPIADALNRHLPPAARQALQRPYAAYHDWVVRRRNRRLFPRLFSEPRPPIQGGPFAGMAYLDASSGSALLAKLIGSYEAELNPVWESLLARPWARVVNIGCAEGYYAVGLARRLPGAEVFAFDLDPRARARCGELAALNEVSQRLQVEGECTPAGLQALTEGRETLVVSDCEGAELALLDPGAVPGLRGSTVVAELHDVLVPGLSDRLLPRFEATHRVRVLEAGPRHPADWPRVADLSPCEQAWALDEYRPPGMTWAVWEPETRD